MSKQRFNVRSQNNGKICLLQRDVIRKKTVLKSDSKEGGSGIEIIRALSKER